MSDSEDVGLRRDYRTSSPKGFLNCVAGDIVAQFRPDESSAFSRLDVEKLCCWMEWREIDCHVLHNNDIHFEHLLRLQLGHTEVASFFFPTKTRGTWT